MEVFVFQDPGGVEAEVYADVAVLFEAGGVEVGAEAYYADSGGFQLPEGVELGFVVGFGGGVGGPEGPVHFELVGGVFVELLGGFGHGGLDDGAFGVGGVGRAGVVDVDALVGGGLGPVDGVGAGGLDSGEGAAGFAVGGDESELAEHSGESGGERLEAEVRVPEA